MWPRNLLIKSDRIIGNIYRWSRYIALRKYTNDNNIDNTNNDNVNKKCPENDIENLLNDAANFNEASDTTWASNPYPEGAVIPSDEPERPKQDPEQTSILLFPGQGTLKVGKAREYIKIPRGKEVFDIANELLNIDLLKLCLNGPQEKLNRTEYNQMATVVTSLAALEKLWEDRPNVIEHCKASVGYSVGEITALIFSGALTLEDGIRLAGVRGAAMQHASDIIPQGMLLIDCLPQTKLKEICDEAKKWSMDMGVSEPQCNIAIYLYTETKVLAGDDESLKYIENNYKRLAIRKPKRLSVSGAFHTPLMQPAIKSFKKALDTIVIDNARIDTYSNVTSKPYHNAEQIRKLLLKQITSPVKWEQIIQSIYRRQPGLNFPRTFELGSHGYLKTLLQRINLKASRSCITI